MAAAAVGYGVAQALTYSPARLISSKLKALRLYGKLLAAVLFA